MEARRAFLWDGWDGGHSPRRGGGATEAEARGRCQVVQALCRGLEMWPSSIGGTGGCPRAHPRPSVQTLFHSDHPVHRAQAQGELSRPAPAELVGGEGAGLPCRPPGQAHRPGEGKEPSCMGDPAWGTLWSPWGM